jgi:hypothetical protein
MYPRSCSRTMLQSISMCWPLGCIIIAGMYQYAALRTALRSPAGVLA